MDHRRPRRARADRGAVIPMVALALTMLMTMTAFAVDLGRMRTERRDLQADADAIALDTVQAIVGLRAAAARPIALEQANFSAARNDLGFVLSSDQVAVGTWDFVNHQFVEAANDDVLVDAVEVHLTDMVEMHFDFSADRRSVSRRAVAVAQGAARGEIGSVLAGLQQNVDPDSIDCRVFQQVGFMNSIYTAMLGITSNVTIEGETEVDTGDCAIPTPGAGLQLDAASWRGLGSGRASLDEIAGEMGLGSKDAFFDGTVGAWDFLDATATVLENSDEVVDQEAGLALRGIVAGMTNEVRNSSQIDVGALVDPGTDDPIGVAGGAGTGNGSAVNAGVDALSLLTGTAMLIDGENFASASVPLTLPYLRQPVQTRIHVIEPPQGHEDLRVAGSDGARSASARVAIDVPLNNVNLNLDLLGIVGTRSAPANLRFVVEVGRAQARYDRIACPIDGVKEVDMSVDTGAVSLGYGTSSPSQLTGTSGVSVSAFPHIDMELSLLLGAVKIQLGGVTNARVVQKFASTTDAAAYAVGEVNLLGAEETHTFTTFGNDSPWQRYDGGISGTNLADTTYAELDYNAVTGTGLNLLGLGSTLDGAVHAMVRNALEPIIENVGFDVIDPLLSSLGITVAGADGRILEANCQMPALANRD